MPRRGAIIVPAETEEQRGLVTQQPDAEGGRGMTRTVSSWHAEKHAGREKNAAEEEEDFSQECSYLSLEIVDALFSKPDGSSTMLFRLVILEMILFGMHWIVPGFLMFPSVPEAMRAGDSLSVLGSMCMATSCGVLAPIAGHLTRKAIHTGPGSVLHRLGAGTGMKLLSANEAKILEAYRQLCLQLPFTLSLAACGTKGNLAKGAHWTVKAFGCISHLLFAFCVFLGAGVHDEIWANRLSMVGIWIWMTVDLYLLTQGRAAMLIAMTLVKARIRIVSKALATELETEGTDMSVEQWQLQVAAPCRELIELMDVLTRAFSGFVAVGVILMLNIAVASTGFVLSSAVHNIIGNLECWFCVPDASWKLTWVAEALVSLCRRREARACAVLQAQWSSTDLRAKLNVILRAVCCAGLRLRGYLGTLYPRVLDFGWRVVVRPCRCLNGASACLVHVRLILTALLELTGASCRSAMT